MKSFHLHIFLGILLATPILTAIPEVLHTPDIQIAKYGLALEAIFGMGVRLQTLLGEETGENFLVSPIGLTLIVGQLMLGADGEFRDQLYELLSLPDRGYQNESVDNIGKYKNESFPLPYKTLHVQLSSLLRDLEGDSNRTFNLKQKSAMFYSDKIVLKEKFKKLSQVIYMSELHSLNFAEAPREAQRKINQWASLNTNGLIPTILSSPPPPSTASLFANAIYFSAEWEQPFSDILNRNGTFAVSKTKSVNVTYMISHLDQIFYAESPDNQYRVIALPYKNEELNMFVILPDKNNPHAYDIRKFTQQLKTNEVLKVVADARRRDVIVKIPKMRLSYTVSVLEELQKFRAFKKIENKTVLDNRMIDIIDKLENRVHEFSNFTAAQDRLEDIILTGAAKNTNLRVNDIVQEVSFSLNEKGTEAAAVTASTIDYIGGSKNFLMDRPFLFFIRHEATAATLLWGTISNPTG